MTEWQPHGHGLRTLLDQRPVLHTHDPALHNADGGHDWLPSNPALTRIVALEKALHALVAKEPTFGTDTGIYCVSCDAEQLSFVEPFVHEPDCPWEVARALLSGS